MKKIIFSLAAVVLLAVGCNGQSVYESQNQNATSSPGDTSTTTTTPPAISNNNQPKIIELKPSSGKVGSSFIISGSGFTATDNTIYFGISTFSGYSSSDGKTLQFTVPGSLKPSCAIGKACPQFIQNVAPGNYNVAVSNANGTSNEVPFKVVFTCPPNAMCATPIFKVVLVSELSPASGPIGSKVTIVGSGFTPTGNKIKFGNLGSENNPEYSLNSSDGKTIVFTVPSSNYYACQASKPPCYPPNYITQPGSYEVSVINSNGSSDSQNFTVTQ